MSSRLHPDLAGLELSLRRICLGLPSSALPVSVGPSALAAAASASSNLMDQELPDLDNNDDADTDTNNIGYFMTDETVC